MTVSSLISRMPEAAGNGVTTAFPYSFKVYEAGHLRVSIINDDSGQETVKTLTTHYTVSGLAPTVGGTVTFLTAPEDGESVRIERIPELDQLTSLKNAGSYFPESVEDALDYARMVDQYLEQRIEDVEESIEDLVIEAGDMFDTKIVAGYDAEFQDVRHRNAADDSTWVDYTNATGDRIIDHESGTEGVLVLNAQGTVQAGLLSYRTLIRSLTDNAYNVTGGDDNARCLRMLSSNGSSNVTVSIPRDADTALTDLFFTNDWLLIQRQTTGTLTIQGGHGDVTITNEYTGAAGAVSVVQKGGHVLLRRTGTNTYVASGDIPKPTLDKVVTLTSTAGACTWDWSLGNVFTITLTENTTITPSNLPSGFAATKQLFIVQDSDTAKTVTFGGTAHWPEGVAYVVTEVLSGTDELSFTCRGDSSTYYGKFSNAFAAP